MKSIVDFDVFAKQFAIHAGSVIKIECKLNTAAGAAVFVQVHDVDAAPANAAVPLKSWPAAGDAELYKEFKHGELHFTKGLYVCVSTTEATLTLGAGSDKFSMVAAELWDVDYPASTSFAGDLTTGIDYLEVWNNAAGPKKLIALEVISTSAAAAYVQLFARDAGSLAGGEKPIVEWSIAAGASLIGVNAFRFGNDGRDIMEVSGNTTYRGCTVAISVTPTTLNPTAASEFKIRAEYK